MQGAEESPWNTCIDPETEKEYIAVATGGLGVDLETADKISDFMEFLELIKRQLTTAQGLVGYSFRAHGYRAWTLSVWEDGEALGTFTHRPPHSKAMDELRPYLPKAEGFTMVQWKVQGPAIPPTWEEALRRLEDRH